MNKLPVPSRLNFLTVQSVIIKVKQPENCSTIKLSNVMELEIPGTLNKTEWIEFGGIMWNLLIEGEYKMRLVHAQKKFELEIQSSGIREVWGLGTLWDTSCEEEYQRLTAVVVTDLKDDSTVKREPNCEKESFFVKDEEEDE